MNHQVYIITSDIDKEVVIRFEVRLKEYDLDVGHKLHKMGFKYHNKGYYSKELYNRVDLKDQYVFQMVFLEREFGKKNIKYYKLQQVA